ncbi:MULTISPECIES: peptide deformylase [Methylobacterium]|uniref:Peptide deformylase-like n=2 Tax=Pseudomonadota TaxID=1224 RepID=A0ABQ4ST82_9HYPH|nr:MULTISPECIES: peptide deformylase [Methylobacterium]PIU07550.1 MAG: peptide deformylase [Methylobacterium sp. CG09_land_8_20_14_0_10_71_15]PIU13337.1 MAG: peptide deformylase [Methylobacterium sp. CG08_land_8_20_14_0_20_71_15]GBU17750.1 peptide deformylase-like protein [Methylobacterium sp.]GJE06420.1 Peptide deformylase [Methylobacterium jeotgali]
MTARPLIYYPDPRLTVAAAPVLAFDEALRMLATDLRDTLDAAAAAGLAAPHIGVAQRVVVLRPEPGTPASLYVNPEIAWASPERVAGPEGSVSMPGVSEPVERAASVRVRYRDLDGSEREESAEGFRAACLQHEIDQLDGVFWIERLSRLRRERARRRYARRETPQR